MPLVYDSMVAKKKKQPERFHKILSKCENDFLMESRMDKDESPDVQKVMAEFC